MVRDRDIVTQLINKKPSCR